MFAVVCLFAMVICIAMTLACFEVKAGGWWLWATGAVVFLVLFALQINS
jgi:hypothetical protein